MLVFAVDDPDRAEPALERALAAEGCAAVVAPHSGGGRELLCAVHRRRRPRPARARCRRPPSAPRRARAGARSCQLARPPRSSCAAPSTRRAARWRRQPSPTARHPRSPPGATSAPSPCCSRSRTTTALALYCDSVLAPIEQGDQDYGEELLRSLEAFIEQNGQWERAAREVYCHRHTLRYRMRKVEELTGRDLSRAHDRIEFWLALRAGSWSDEGRDPAGDQGRRVPRGDHPSRRAGDGRARPRGAASRPGPGRAADSPTPTTRRRARGSSPTPRRVRRRRDDPPRQGATAAGDRDAAPRSAPLHLPAPRARPRADPRALRLRCHCIAYETVEDGAGDCRCWRR